MLGLIYMNWEEKPEPEPEIHLMNSFNNVDMFAVWYKQRTLYRAQISFV